MMQPTQDRLRDHLTTTQFWWIRRSKWLRDLLFDALMWSHVIKILHISLEHVIHMPLMESKDVIKTLAAYAPQIAFSDGIRSRSPVLLVDEAVILLHDVVEVLHSTQLTVLREDPLCFQFLEGFWIGCIFIHGDDTRSADMRCRKRF
jgi:hypothetical protein